MEVVLAPELTLKKKMKDRYSIEDMYTFDHRDLEKAKRKKDAEATDAAHNSKMSKEHWEKAMKRFAKISGDSETTKPAKKEIQQQDKPDEIDKADKLVLRFPSPNRTRRESPKKTSTIKLNTSVPESSCPRAMTCTFHDSGESVVPEFEPRVASETTESICNAGKKAPKIVSPMIESNMVLGVAESTGNAVEKAPKIITVMIESTNDSCSTPADARKDPHQGGVKDKIKKFENKASEIKKDADRKPALKEVNDARDAQVQNHQGHNIMDDILKHCFLQAITTRIMDRDFPMLGTTLYDKHMQMCRRISTSCNVQDSSFVSLQRFLVSLEDDGLLKIRWQAEDPTVISVNRHHLSVHQWQPWPHKSTVACLKVKGGR